MRVRSFSPTKTGQRKERRKKGKSRYSERNSFPCEPFSLLFFTCLAQLAESIVADFRELISRFVPEREAISPRIMSLLRDFHFLKGVTVKSERLAHTAPNGSIDDLDRCRVPTRRWAMVNDFKSVPVVLRQKYALDELCLSCGIIKNLTHV
ncbi:hypothetical protein EVAR_62578_1 [Eumeta japonica]|uniref:Uncharacterized protein n=1 Tax=Eumeta variegata TaxID=151549 RepID=A0A4C1YB94_EUMVA|nr:hypothetical protein EVAR_62578_1 [Eumeta japonica]